MNQPIWTEHTINGSCDIAGRHLAEQCGAFREGVPVIEVAFHPHTHLSGIFDRLERLTPEQRAHLFLRPETRWCWDCGMEQAECEGHPEAARVGEGER